MAGVSDVLGPWYVGQQLAVMLLGASIVQSWVYLKNYHQDPLYLKVVVLALMILGIVITVLISAGLYELLVLDIGRPTDPSAVPWTLRVGLFVLSPIIIATVHCFYAFRLYRLRKNLILLFLVMGLGLSPLPLGFIVAAVELGRASSLISSKQSEHMTISALVLMMACDAIITTAMVQFLYKHRSGIKSTENMMSTLTNYIIASGFTTFVATCLVLLMYVALPQEQIYSAMSFLLSHLYVNSLLALLNARRSLRRRTSLTTSVAAGDREQNAAMPPFFMPWDSPQSVSVYPSTTMEFELGSVPSQAEHVFSLQRSFPAPSEDGKRDASCQKS
ncbi:hypothetical protein AURDEDRAFT_166781 [Auricularia subglabra TFB-10046 SS5]|nr:hypothetical protein AURDEDRAFT_166781 [Auricularia subglabra TFB-10046 SS5]